MKYAFTKSYLIKDASKTQMIRVLSCWLSKHWGTPETYGVCCAWNEEISGASWHHPDDRSRYVSFDRKKNTRTGITAILVTFSKSREEKA